MIKRPLNPRFSQAVLDGRKTTTIRNSCWPQLVNIMLYNWEGLPYRSRHINVAVVSIQRAVRISITHRKDGRLLYSTGDPKDSENLFATEGFESQEDMDNWFRPLIKPGAIEVRHLMRFHLVESQEGSL